MVVAEASRSSCLSSGFSPQNCGRNDEFTKKYGWWSRLSPERDRGPCLTSGSSLSQNIPQLSTIANLFFVIFISFEETSAHASNVEIFYHAIISSC